MFVNLLLVCCLLIVFTVCVLFVYFSCLLFVCLGFLLYLLTVLALPMLEGARASGVRAARACALWESYCAGRALSAHTRISRAYSF